MAERDFMEAWQKVFDYQKKDKDVFDNDLRSSFRERDIDGLMDAMSRLIRITLFQPDCIFGKKESAALQDMMSAISPPSRGI